METVKLNFLLIGKTGEGKSTTGNKILDKEVFEKFAETEAKTKEVKYSSVRFKNYNLKVVDGPGLDDTAKTKVEDRKTFSLNMTTALAMCYDGVDAFILVIRFPIRFTTQERAVLDSLKRIFGDRFMSHVIVVVTFGDIFYTEFEDNPKNFNEWCREQGGAFRDLYSDCQGRFVLFNNKEKDEKKKVAQKQHLVELAHSLKRKSGRYTSKSFEDAKEQRQIQIQKEKAAQLTSEFQDKIGLLTAAIDKFCTNPEKGDKERIKARIDDLNREIDQHGMLDNLRHLMKKLEEDFNDVDSLHRLYRQLKDSTDLWDGILSANPAIDFLRFAALYISCAALNVAYDLIADKDGDDKLVRFDADKIQTEINEIEKKRKYRQQFALTNSCERQSRLEGIFDFSI